MTLINTTRLSAILGIFLLAGCDSSLTTAAALPITVDAGPDLASAARATVQLNVTNEATLGELSYEWTQTSGIEVVLSQSNIANPTFEAPNTDAIATLEFTVAVSSDLGPSGTDSVTVTVKPIGTMIVIAETAAADYSELLSVDPGSGETVSLSGMGAFSINEWKWNADQTRIAYRTYHDTEGEGLHLVSPDGSNPIDIVANDPDVSIEDYEWTNDGTRLIYSGEIGTDNEQLYSVLADGSAPANLSNGTPATNEDLSWWMFSGDGSRVVMIGDLETEGTNEVFSVQFDGTEKTKLNAALTASLQSVYEVPGAARIVYWTGSRGISQLFTVDLDGNNHASISGQGTISSARVSPTGDHIAFNYENSARLASGPELFVTPIAGGTPVKVSDPAMVGRVLNFEWTEDGTRIVYEADQETSNVEELYATDTTGTTRNKLNLAFTNTNGDIRGFSISPDGAHVAYIADAETDGMDEGFLVKMDGTGAAKMSEELTSTSDDVRSIYWAPDSSRLVFTHYQRSRGSKLQAFFVLADGSGRVQANGLMTNNGSVEDIDWLEDSSGIVYQARQETNNKSEVFMSSATDATTRIKLNQQVRSVSMDGFRLDNSQTYVSMIGYNRNGYWMYVAGVAGDEFRMLELDLATSGSIWSFEWSPNDSDSRFRGPVPR